MKRSKTRKLFLHVGPHKTGTTYIQRNLLQNREVLADVGVLYPKTGQAPFYGHHLFAHFLAGRSAPDFDPAALRAEVGNAPNVVLSSEILSTLDQSAIQHLQETFSNFDPRVVIFARARGPLLYSTWQENVRHGQTLSLPEMVSTHVDQPSNSELINKRLLIDRFAQVFGEAAIRLVVYDNVPGNLFEFFATRVLGVRSRGLVGDGKRDNARFAPVVIEILRTILSIAQTRGLREPLPLRNAFYRYSSTTEGRAELARWREVYSTKLRRMDLGDLDLDYDHMDDALCVRFGKQILAKESCRRLFSPTASRGDNPFLHTSDILPTDIDRLNQLSADLQMSVAGAP